MAATLAGEAGHSARRDGAKLAIAAVRHLGGSKDLLAVRRTMCGMPSGFAPLAALEPVARAWRAVQVRQAFRLALEALFYWAQRQLDFDGAKTTGALVDIFINGAGNSVTAEKWIDDSLNANLGPADWVFELERALIASENANGLERVIRSALAASLREAPESAGVERNDRLPLFRAAKEARERMHISPAEFLKHVFESWIFGQHAYWSVGRGLADARGRGKTILRLRVTLEEEGWTLVKGARAGPGTAPAATGDRLNTLLSLMREAHLTN